MSQVLSCWKEIAQYVGKGVRTVQRWERTAGFPVRRPMPGYNAVLAYTEELDSWLGRTQEMSEVAELRAKVAELTALNENLQWQLALRSHLAGDEAGGFAWQELRESCKTLRTRTAELSRTLARTIAIANDMSDSRELLDSGGRRESPISSSAAD